MTRTPWTAPDVRGDRHGDARRIRGTSPTTPSSAPAGWGDTRGSRGARRTDPDLPADRARLAGPGDARGQPARVLEPAAGTAEPVPGSRLKRLPPDRSQRAGE